MSLILTLQNLIFHIDEPRMLSNTTYDVVHTSTLDRIRENTTTTLKKDKLKIG